MLWKKYTHTSLAKEAKDVLCCLAGRHVPQAMSTFNKPRGTEALTPELLNQFMSLLHM
jgi:hypothetical protein